MTEAKDHEGLQRHRLSYNEPRPRGNEKEKETQWDCIGSRFTGSRIAICATYGRRAQKMVGNNIAVIIEKVDITEDVAAAGEIWEGYSGDCG